MHPIPEYDQLEATIVEASREFLQTGKIPDALLQCYDQHGRWLGGTAASEFVDFAAEQKLAKITIPEDQRTLTNESRESILLTSFILEEEPEDERLEEEYLTEEEVPIEKDPILVLPWHEIRGMCQVAIHRNLSCPNLQRLNPHYSPVRMQALTVQLTKLPQVNSISLYADHVSIPKLEKATYLEFGIASHVDAPSLDNAGQLKLGSAYSARLPQLRQVDGQLVGYAIREFHAPLLEAVNPTSTGYDGLVLPEAWTIDAPNLRHVGKRLDASSDETFYPTGLKVDGRWIMHPRMKARLAMRGPIIEL